MIDTHTHIYGTEFDSDRDEVVARSIAAGVDRVVLPNENVDSLPRLLSVGKRYPDFCRLAVGLHPEEVDDTAREQLDRLESLLDAHPWVAVGEIGIDLYWDTTWRDRQMEALNRQLGWCADRDLPFIIHCRKALDEVLEVMDGFKGLRGVFHCFGGDTADVDRIRRRGDFYFGIGGVVTFKKSTLPAVLPAIGVDRILLETDAPYMAPVPHRGKRNEPAFIPLIAAKIADTLGLTPAEVDQTTTRSAERLFNLC